MTDDSSGVASAKRPRMGRPTSRNEALSVIEPRFRELMATGTPGVLAKLACITRQVSNLQLEFVEVPHTRATYVMVSEGRERLFTGYLDPDPPGKHLGGKVRIISWKRGDWESRLLGYA